MHDETIANGRLLVLIRLLMKFGWSMKWQKLSHCRCPDSPSLCRICAFAIADIIFWLVRYHTWGMLGVSLGSSHKIFLHLPTLCSSNLSYTTTTTPHYVIKLSNS